MKNLKSQRSIWIFVGLFFLMSTILFLSDDKTNGLRSVFMGILLSTHIMLIKVG